MLSVSLSVESTIPAPRRGPASPAALTARAVTSFVTVVKGKLST
jgi:hypothetical protein